MTDQSIYEEVRAPLMRFAASLAGPDNAADLVSEVVVATLRRRTLTSLENPLAYLMQAVLNKARSVHRRRHRERDALRRYAVMSGGDEPTYDLVIGGDVARTVAGLPPQQRAAIYLVYWVDMEPIKAADLLGVRPATLRRYLHLARRTLRRYLDE